MSAEAPSSRLDAAPEGGRHREFAVAWRDASDRPSIWPVGILEFVEGRYRFDYVKGAARIPGFRTFLEFPRFGESYVSEELFSFFSQRVMDKGRPDYQAYLTALALPADASDLDVLGRSGGRRKADNVQVVEIPRSRPDGSTSFTFLVHGIRFSPSGDDAVMDALSRVRAGDPLSLVNQADNPVNPRALLVCTGEGTQLGWVPDLLVEYFTLVRRDSDWTLSIVQVNGPEVASQARLVAKIAGHLPPDALPFGGPEWEI